MSDVATIGIAILSSGAMTAVVNAVINGVNNRRSKKKGVEKRLENIEGKVDKLTESNDLQYMSILRLTVMDTDMPMSERLIAGKEYIAKGGNGDVRHYYKDLEASVNHEIVQRD